MTSRNWTRTTLLEHFATHYAGCDPVQVFTVNGSTPDSDPIWADLLARAARRRLRLNPVSSAGHPWGEAGSEAGAANADNSPPMALTGEPRADARQSLYRPLVDARTPFVLAHLGQSIDGCIATASGHSLFVTGDENLNHLHRLRALSDAVLVGAGTAAADNPRLTVRRVAGPSPVRVILDRRGSVPSSLGLFNDDGPETLVVTTRYRTAHPAVPSERLLQVPEVDGRMDPLAVRDVLSARGLALLFLEGGGVTVSDWLRAGALDRLHIAIAPVLIGAGRRGVQLPSAIDMPSALRPPATLHQMGEDVLWDLDVAALRDHVSGD